MIDRPSILNSIPVPYSASLPELAEQLRPPGPQAWAAIMAIGHKSAQSALDVLVGLLDDPDWRYRRSALEAIAFHPLAHSVTVQIVERLSDDSPFVVRTGCKVVSKLRLSQGHERLVGLLSARTPATRESAVTAISNLWHASDFDVVLSLYRDDPVERVRKAAAWTLFHNRSSQNWRILFSS